MHDGGDYSQAMPVMVAEPVATPAPVPTQQRPHRAVARETPRKAARPKKVKRSKLLKRKSSGKRR